jgi:hypothetical protein
MKLPVILRKHGVVIVSQMDLIRRGRQTSGGCDSKESGVDWTKRDEVRNRGEEL